MSGSVGTREPGKGQNTVTQRTKRESKSRKDRDRLYAGNILSSTPTDELGCLSESPVRNRKEAESKDTHVLFCHIIVSGLMSAADVSGKFYKAQNNMASRSFILEDFSLLRGCRRIEIQDLSWFSLKIPEAFKKFLKNRSVKIYT